MFGCISAWRLSLLPCLLLSGCLPCLAQNPIQIENANAGSSDWQLSNPATGREIEGYASLTAVNVGGSINFFVSTIESSFSIEIFRTGWYGGLGARLMATVSGVPGVLQPTPSPDPATGLVECRWSISYTLQVPSSWTSGVYLARLTNTASGKQSYIIFVVRDDARTSDFLYEASFTTYEAYNFWPGGADGKSLYAWAPGGRAVKVSFNRPYALGYSYVAGQSEGVASGLGAGEYLTNLQPGPYTTGYPISSAGFEYNMVRWLEKEGYDVTYATNVDIHENGSLLLNHKGFLSVGHNEYWSRQMRVNVQNALNNGVNLGIFSANTGYWQIRIEPGSDGSLDRTMVCYKADAAASDPDYNSNPQVATVTWRSAPVNEPEASLVGVEYVGDPWNGDIVIADASHWLMNNTGLKNGDHLSGLLGYEVDAYVPGISPANTQILASSPVGPLHDHDDPPGTNCGGTCNSNMTWYWAGKAAVFATGSIQWSWGLDDFNAPSLRPATSSVAAQQITRNVLASFLNAITITAPSALPPATVGEPYQFGFSTLTGPNQLTWAADGLPAYLSLSSEGVLTGTPPEPGNISFSVTATNDQGDTASGIYSLSINASGYNISGRVTLSRFALHGISVMLSNGLSTLTDPSGHYAFTNLASGTYTVMPVDPRYLFCPPSQTITTNQNQTANFDATAPPAHAISIDFIGQGTAMAPSETAGVVSESNWNSLPGNANPVPQFLMDETGANSGATVTWSADNVWSTPITDTPGDARMMKGYLDTVYGDPTIVTVAGLPSSPTGYDIYVYVDGDNQDATKTASYTLSDADFNAITATATDGANSDFSGVFQQADSSLGNYIRFTVQATSFTLTATPGSASNGAGRAAVNGIQIIPAQSSSAPSVISVDFVGTGTPMDPSESSGVVPRSNWNAALGNASSNPLLLVDEFGDVTSATVTWTSDNVWSTPIPDTPGDARMMRGYLDTASGSASTITVTGLATAKNGYDVYVYLDGDNGGAAKTATYSISDSGITSTSSDAMDASGSDFSGSFTQAVNGSAGNYVKFTIQGTAFTITATAGEAANGAPRAPVNGIQIVPSADSPGAVDFVGQGTPMRGSETAGVISKAR